MTGPRPDALAATLRRLREAADLSQREAARHTGLAQARLSRMEQGRRIPDDDDVRVLAKAYAASPDVRRDLLAQARALRPTSTPARTVLQRGGHLLQHRIHRMEDAAESVRAFQTAIILGLLQTHDYARALLSGTYSGDQLDQVVAARLERQKGLATGHWHLVMTEGALRWHVGSPAIMVRQLRDLAAVTDRPNIDLGIIPWTRPTTRSVLHGFTILDEQVVLVGTETATANHTDPSDVAHYAEKFAIYADLADYGQNARSVLERIAAEYSAL